MTNDIAIRDDMKSIERWENEGGRVSPLNNVWATLKRFRAGDDSRETQVTGTQKNLGQQPGVFRGLTCGGQFSET